MPLPASPDNNAERNVVQSLSLPLLQQSALSLSSYVSADVTLSHPVHEDMGSSVGFEHIVSINYEWVKMIRNQDGYMGKNLIQVDTQCLLCAVLTERAEEKQLKLIGTSNSRIFHR